MSAPAHRLAFFRQSGWLLIATTAGGAFMWLVHIPAIARLPQAEYGVFLALLQVMNLMLIPAIGLQTVFAQQAAGAVSPLEQRQLAWTVRRVLTGVAAIWLAMLALIFLVREPILTSMKIGNPAALWLTVASGLAMLWWPILQGVLQGRQDFLWLGWLQVINGCGRFLAVLVLVVALGAWAAGAMTAALIGFWLTVAVAAWRSRTTWLAAGQALPWRHWLRRVVPLTLGLGAAQFMMAADQVVVQNVFELTGPYGAAGMIGRALMFFTGPMVAVMFPKVAAAAARSERTNVLAQALGATALLGGAGALACTLFPELPLRIVRADKYLAIAPLVPWFAWCMLPLTLSNVLISNLLARQRTAAVPWLVAIAATYGLALWWRAHSVYPAAALKGFAAATTLPGVFAPISSSVTSALLQARQLAAFPAVVATLGVFSVLLLAVTAFFTWRLPGPAARSPAAR